MFVQLLIVSTTAELYSRRLKEQRHAYALSMKYVLEQKYGERYEYACVSIDPYMSFV